MLRTQKLSESRAEGAIAEPATEGASTEGRQTIEESAYVLSHNDTNKNITGWKQNGDSLNHVLCLETRLDIGTRLCIH